MKDNRDKHIREYLRGRKYSKATPKRKEIIIATAADRFGVGQDDIRKAWRKQ
jgi:hypothetical protein